MPRLINKFERLAAFCLLLVLLGACSDSSDTGDAASTTEGSPPAAQGDIIARVGDQTISFGEINTMMNSSAIVGLSMPALGTPERDVVRVTLLDKMISANLLYLDALQQGVDQDPGYQRDLQNFSDAILAALYREKILSSDVEVTDAEIQAFYQNNIMPGTELTDELRSGLEATIRKNTFKTGVVAMRTKLRKDNEVAVYEQELVLEDDPVRDDATKVASIDGEAVTWGDVKATLTIPRNATSPGKRLEALNNIIDTRLSLEAAREAGLQQDPVFLSRTGEFGKTRLINLHRNRLIKEMDPSEEDVRAYYEQHREQILIPEARSIQMVVVKTREEAEQIKQKIASRATTMSKAAADYSTVPDASMSLGKMGWVSKGSGFPQLDELTFSLGPGEVGEPIESPAGWHLVTVLDMRDPVHDSVDNPTTYKETRRLMIEEKQEKYVVSLRENGFKVEIYDEVMSRLAQQEVDWFAEVSKTREVPPEEVKAQIEKLRE